MQNLSGTWEGQDNITYYFTQIENTLYIHGNGDIYKNVGFGTINADDSQIILKWADTPNSQGFGLHGICYLDASQAGVITKVAGKSKYGIGNFTKIG